MMAVKNATFNPLLVPTNRDTTYITIVETIKPITKIKTEEAEYAAAIELIDSLYLIYLLLVLGFEKIGFEVQ
jgi:hypothetical protein